jgi:hypothetical protein
VSFPISSLVWVDKAIFTIDDTKRHIPENTKEAMRSMQLSLVNYCKGLFVALEVIHMIKRNPKKKGKGDR